MVARRDCRPRLEPMANSRRILIVDDDADMRDALVEQLALHDEFEAVAVDTGATGLQAARAGEIDQWRPVSHRRQRQSPTGCRFRCRGAVAYGAFPNAGTTR